MSLVYALERLGDAVYGKFENYILFWKVGCIFLTSNYTAIKKQLMQSTPL